VAKYNLPRVATHMCPHVNKKNIKIIFYNEEQKKTLLLYSEEIKYGVLWHNSDSTIVFYWSIFVCELRY